MSPKAVEDDFVFPWRHAMYHPIWWLTLRPIPNFKRLEIRMRADANTFQHICHMPSTSQRNGFAFSKEVMEVLLLSILQESAWNPRSTNYSSERWFSPMTLCTVNARTKAVLQRIIKCFANDFPHQQYEKDKCYEPGLQLHTQYGSDGWVYLLGLHNLELPICRCRAEQLSYS